MFFLRAVRLLAFIGMACWLLASSAQAQLPPYLMVERIGGTAGYGAGASALNTAATAVFLDQFNPTTGAQVTPLQTVTLPVTVSGSQQILTDSGSGTTAGYFTRFGNGQGYTLSGYNATVGTASVASSAPGTISRTFGIVTPSGSSFTVDTASGFNDGGTAPAFRTAASWDGSSLYAGTSSGIRYQNAVGTVSTTASVVTNNLRTVRIQNGSLFFNTTSALFLAGGVGSLPTGSVTPVALPNALTASGTGTPLANSFMLFNNPLNTNDWNGTGFNTFYIGDERTSANGGGIQRWVYDGTNWNFTTAIGYTLNGNGGGVRGLTASIDLSVPGTPVVNIWATSIQTNANNLVYMTDTLTAGGGTFGSYVTLATAPGNTVFRGLDLAISVPEPTTYALASAALVLGYLGVRRQQKRQLRLMEQPVR